MELNHMSNIEAFNKIMSEIGEQLTEETITAIKAALEVPEEKYIYGTPLLDAMTKEKNT
jgi:hypothetical protein